MSTGQIASLLGLLGAGLVAHGVEHAHEYNQALDTANQGLPQNAQLTLPRRHFMFGEGPSAESIHQAAAERLTNYNKNLAMQDQKPVLHQLGYPDFQSPETVSKVFDANVVPRWKAQQDFADDNQHEIDKANSYPTARAWLHSLGGPQQPTLQNNAPVQLPNAQRGLQEIQGQNPPSQPTQLQAGIQQQAAPLVSYPQLPQGVVLGKDGFDHLLAQNNSDRTHAIALAKLPGELQGQQDTHQQKAQQWKHYAVMNPITEGTARETRRGKSLQNQSLQQRMSAFQQDEANRQTLARLNILQRTNPIGATVQKWNALKNQGYISEQERVQGIREELTNARKGAIGAANANQIDGLVNHQSRLLEQIQAEKDPKKQQVFVNKLKVVNAQLSRIGGKPIEPQQQSSKIPSFAQWKNNKTRTYGSGDKTYSVSF